MRNFKECPITCDEMIQEVDDLMSEAWIALSKSDNDLPVPYMRTVILAAIKMKLEEHRG